MNNQDMQKIMNILSQMDKKDLQEGLAKASQILNTKNGNDIINEIKKNMN